MDHSLKTTPISHQKVSALKPSHFPAKPSNKKQTNNMKTTQTISILATLALGITSANAGRGCTIVVPGAATQIQHASHAKHTFAVGQMYSYKINSMNYCLKTMDASSPGNKIVLYNNGNRLTDIMIPLVRKRVKEGTVTFDPPITLTNDINLLFDFEHTASAFGAIALNVECIRSAPEASGKLVAPTYANTEDHPNIDWTALLSVKTNTSVTDVSGTICGARVAADNCGTTRTKRCNKRRRK